MIATKANMIQPIDRNTVNHRNVSFGPFQVVNISEQFWHVQFQGKTLYSDKYRHQAIRHAKALLNEYNRMNLDLLCATA